MTILPTAYLPPRSWFRLFRQSNTALEVMETYPKQTFRNRCNLPIPAGGHITLTVPVISSERHQFTRDVRVSYQQHWQHQHWMALVSTYKHTPYFDYYQDFLRPVYEQQITYLVDLNWTLIDIVNSLIDNRPPLSLPSSMPATNDWHGVEWTDRHPWQKEDSILGALFEWGSTIVEQADESL